MSSAPGSSASRQPLEGLRVAELVGPATPLHLQLAIAMAGKIASELGAEVVVARSDAAATASLPQHTGDSRALHAFLYEGKSLLQRLPADAMTRIDAVLTGPDVALPQGKTAVVISDFGTNPHLRHVKASELTILAMSGLLHVMAEQAGVPVRLPGHQPAYAAGLAAYIAMTAGLLSRTPRVADVSMLDAMLWVDWKLPAVTLLDRDAAPTRGGEWQAVAAKDGHIALVYQDRDWPGLVDLLDLPALRDARFATRSKRLTHLDALMDIVRPWFAQRSKSEIYALAKSRGLPLGPVWTPADIQRDAQYLERDFLRLLPKAGFLPRIPLMWNGVRPGVPALPARVPAGEMANA